MRPTPLQASLSGGVLAQFWKPWPWFRVMTAQKALDSYQLPANNCFGINMSNMFLCIIQIIQIEVLFVRKC